MRTLCIFFMLLVLPAISHADTLDSYRVFFHGKQIAIYSEGQTIRIVLKSDSVRIGDSLHVKVFRDAPCSGGCSYSMLIFGGRGPVYVDSLQTTQSFSIPLRPLMQHKFQTGANEFNGYYTEYFDGTNRSRVISFKIILQGL